jgi:hypothetical protein
MPSLHASVRSNAATSTRAPPSGDAGPRQTNAVVRLTARASDPVYVSSSPSIGA